MRKEEGETSAWGTLNHSPYRTALTQEVLRKLHKAIDVPAQRGECLRQLFADVALEVDERAKALLYGSSDGDGVSLCFYEILAEHYSKNPEAGKAVLPLFVQLWSQSFVSQIFALLFYRWLFEIPTEQSEGFLRYSTAFLEGTNSIFWLDIQSNVRRFHAVYHYIMEAATSPIRLNKLPTQSRRDLILLVSRFFFYYEPANNLDDLLEHLPVTSEFNGAAAADVFVIELTDQLQRVKVEPVLLHYLNSARALRGKELRVTTSTRLKTALFSFTSPGGPMYPTRPVRHAAWSTLDWLFPVGKLSRHVISLLFRLLHPYYWPGSFWNFGVTSVLALVEAIVGLVLRVWFRFTQT